MRTSSVIGSINKSEVILIEFLCCIVFLRDAIMHIWFQQQGTLTKCYLA
uniref:Uncharacterized protein n=1 Tax=Anguilla anguilla TaxID=7936 RepID=A0A0E9SDL1_ANGAN